MDMHIFLGTDKGATAYNVFGFVCLKFYGAMSMTLSHVHFLCRTCS
jgi:hypothetical protein